MSISQNIIDSWEQKIDTNQKAQYSEARKLNYWHYTIGLPATILSAIAGATLLSQSTNPTLQIVVGVTGVVAAILTGVQTFYSFAKRSEESKATATQLGGLRRDIEILKQFPPDDPKELEKRIREINERMTEIDSRASVININVTLLGQ